jgi:hypothetical protein
MNTHFLAGMTPINMMTESRNHLTADELSRGKSFWYAQKNHAYRVFTRTTGDERLQKILDFVGKCDEAICRCPTYSPCSRSEFLPNGGRL